MTKHILVVEDDEDIARNLRDLLESEGYGVDVAQNGKIALDKLFALSSLPSLILLDLMMPIMDGYQFREIQESDPKLSSIPVVVMTADGQIESKKQKLGATSYLRKPLDVDTVLSVVESNTR